MPDELDQAIELLRAGDRVQSRALLLKLVEQNPDDERAWGWLSNAAQTYDERLRCLQQVLRINPENAPARDMLRKLESQDWAASIPTAKSQAEFSRAAPPLQSPPAANPVSPGLAGKETIQSLTIVLLVIMILYWLGIGFVQLAAALTANNTFDLLCWGGWNIVISIINGLLIPPVVAKKKTALRSIYFLAIVGSVFGVFQMLLASAYLQVCAVPLYVVLGLLGYANKDVYVN
jgi:tetratricopeptide (TPR) repeat protein